MQTQGQDKLTENGFKQINASNKTLKVNKSEDNSNRQMTHVLRTGGQVTTTVQSRTGDWNAEQHDEPAEDSGKWVVMLYTDWVMWRNERQG